MIDTTTDSPDKVMVDWVGTYVQYPELNVTTVSVANNPEKGDDVQFNITIENIGSGYATDVEARIKIADVSYDWSGYICDSLDWDSILYANTIESHTITIPKFFNYSGKYYAWNAGYYDIDQLDVQCDEGATNNYTTDESFTINTASTHIVFVAAIVYDDLSTSTVETTFNDIETHSLNVSESDSWQETTFSTLFSTDFQLQIFESDHDTSGVQWDTNWITWFSGEGKDILGINYGIANWSNDMGTRSRNHGFDILAGFLDDLGEGTAVGVASNNMMTIQASHLDISKVYLHEVLHTYMHLVIEDGVNKTEHLQYSNTWATFNIIHSPFIWNDTTEKWDWNQSYQIHNYTGKYVMSPPYQSTPWYLHPTAEYYAIDNEDQYDGFP
jgi:hypothetical protein